LKKRRIALPSRSSISPTRSALSLEVSALRHQLDWFRRQLFGQKSERRLLESNAAQLSLGEVIDAGEGGSPPPVRAVAAHTRQAAVKRPEASAEGVPFFDETRVPVEVIKLAAPETAGLSPEQFEVIGEKVSYRLGQRPGAYVILKYVRPVIKRHDTQALACAGAPASVIEGSRADVSFVAGLLVDKFAYHMPLYRQHQRLIDAGFTVSRPWLTQLATQAALLLEPIYAAQFDSIRASRVKSMDETPIKAGRSGAGKMKAAYFWPVYGERDEVCFPFFDSCKAACVEQALGLTAAEGALLLSEGYSAYARYAEKTGLTHAQCWSHARRKFFEASQAEPQAAAQALEFIGALYRVEEHIRSQALSGEKKRDWRLTHAKPIIEQFFDWVNRQFEAHGFLPSNPLTAALAYTRERRAGLTVFLTDPDVPIDTNHLERALRAIPMGRKAWLFCWTEVGARIVGIVQSLIVTCRLHQVDPYDYLIDVLQRVGQHPANRVHELTPRL
jgi:transposase